VIALLGLLVAAIVLLVLFLIRRNRMKCKDCRRPVAHGEQCRECREKEELKDRGRMEDGVLVVEPVPPGPNADFGEPEQVRVEEEERPADADAASAPVGAVPSEANAIGEVTAEEAASALEEAGIMDSAAPATRPPIREPESLPPTRKASVAGLATSARRVPSTRPEAASESPPATAPPPTTTRSPAARSTASVVPPALPASDLDRRPPGRVAVGSVKRTPPAVEKRAVDDPAGEGGVGRLSARERLEKIRKEREARAGR
jgi:hypothetical protein